MDKEEYIKKLQELIIDRNEAFLERHVGFINSKIYEHTHEMYGSGLFTWDEITELETKLNKMYLDFKKL